MPHFPPLRTYDILYSERSKLLLPLAKKVIRTKWPNAHLIERLIDVTYSNAVSNMAIAGLIYKDSKVRPNIIKIFQKERAVHNIYRHMDKCVDPKDEIFVEDSHARVKLSGNIDKNKYCTGIAVALLGTVNENGDFVVSEVSDLGFPPQLTSLDPKSSLFYYNILILFIHLIYK